MTKFFQDNNPPKVWDKVKNKVTVIFQEGEFETDNPALAALLVKAGYRYNGTLPELDSPTAPAKESKPKRMVRKKK